ncbi:MAG: TolC family protein [Chitinophagaceae bacterium]
MKISVVLIIFLMLFYSANSQSGKKLSSGEAVQMALENNLNIKIVKADLAIADVNNNWGNAGRYPTVNGTLVNTEAVSSLNQKLSNGNELNKSGVKNNVLNANLNFNWRVYNGRRVMATKQRLEELEKIGDINVSREMQRISYEVLLSYYNIVRLNQQIKATEAIIALSDERNKIAEARYEIGSGAKTDMLQSKIDLNEQKLNLTDIKRQIANNMAIINALMKRPVHETFEVGDSTFQIPEIDYEIAISKIDTQNLDLLRSDIDKAILLRDRIIINSQRIPSLNITSNTNYNRNNSTAGFFLTNQTYGPNVGLNITLPIFNNNTVRTQIRVNNIQQQQQQYRKELLKSQIERDILTSYQDLKNALDIATIEKKNISIAEENNFIATERFKKLQSNSIELRQAQLSLIQAQDRYINAMYRAKIASLSIQNMISEIGDK